MNSDQHSPTPTQASSVPIITSPGVSRDEMNLAEFPLTVLSTRVPPGLKTLEFSDTVQGKGGEAITRRWIITAADKFGLPTASDDEVLLGLLKLTVDTGFQSQKVFFTRYELLRALRWSTEGKNYQRLQRALDRLSGVRIKASNAFFDNSTKSHSTVNFGIIDAYEIHDGREDGPSRPSFFIWSEVLFRSFQVGFIKKLDLDFYLSLQSAVSKRLFRYLDKHFWYKSRIRIPLFVLAHEKLGISRNYKFASSLRQQIEPALLELRGVGCLSSYEFVGKGRATEVIVEAASGRPRVNAKPRDEARAHRSSQGELPLRSPGSAEEDVSETLAKRLSRALVERGLTVSQVQRLLVSRGLEDLQRIEAIVHHFDSLVRARSHLVSKNPVGFLYRAVESPRDFSLPSDEMKSAAPRADESHQRQRATSGENGREVLEAEYLVARKRELARIRAEIEPGVLVGLQQEVEEALRKLRGLISDARFEETVQVGVEERLAKLFAVPDFETWFNSRRRKRPAEAA